MNFQSLFRKKSVAATHDTDDAHSPQLVRNLNLRDLTFMGIAAIIGAGSFSSLGQACYSGGPGVVILFII